MKKTFSLMLALMLSLSLLAMPAMAAEHDVMVIMPNPNASTPSLAVMQQNTAEALKYLNLFRGSDKGFELDRAPTRMEAIIMLIRLLGKENMIYGDENGNPYEHPFTDAPAWQDANEYLGYAYHAGLTNGTSATTFTPDEPASLREVTTLTLRALGYADTDSAKLWDIWAEKSAEIGLTPDYLTADAFTRGDAVMLYWNALYCKLNGTEQLLHENLVENYVFHEDAMNVAADLRTGNINLTDSGIGSIMAALYAKVPADFRSIASMPLAKDDAYSLEWYIGSSDIAITEGIASEPMMSSVAHSVVLVRLENADDAESAMETMKATVNPRKWVCVGVEPENIKTAAVGDLVLLVLDNDYSDAFVDAFLSLAK